MRGHTAGAQVGRARDQRPSDIPDPAGDQPGIRQVADSHGDVDAFIEQVDDAVDEHER